MRARGGVMSKLIDAIKKNREKVLRELFANESDCYIDDKEVRTGPPPSYKKIKKKIARQVKKL
jgi:hypothetical protein